MLRRVGLELRLHAPFTAVGTLTGVAIILVVMWTEVPRFVSRDLFWTLHPLHVLLSALVTASIYRLRGSGKLWATIAVGYLGSIGIATLSDSIIPYVGEWLLALPAREPHLGFIEKWWLVNPLALVGAVVGYLRPTTRLAHGGHVLLSTWASLFHMNLAVGGNLTPGGVAIIGVFLFLAVWIPCCTSDIVFPLLVAGRRSEGAASMDSLVIRQSRT
jgi:hypothetical protein